MSKQDQTEQSEGRSELPIERGFPIERVNEIAEKESRAKQYYRPIYTMHKWWARRPGCLFRAITLYSLLDENTTADDVEVYEPGENQQLGSNGLDRDNLIEAIDDVDMDDPESLWDFYPKDVRIKDKKILDPFMGGGTSLVEASRYGVDSVGVDLNPVAWFVTKKQIDAGQTDVGELEEAFNQVKESVADEILQYYRTPCPNADVDMSVATNDDPFDHGHDHEADVMYNFWVKEVDCTACGHNVSLFKDYRVAKGRYENDDKYTVFCPSCESLTLVNDWQEESECSECEHHWTPKEGNVSRGGNYSCPSCGQKYSINDAIQEQDGYSIRLYAVEYYCPTCDQRGANKGKKKGYKSVQDFDIALYGQAEGEWKNSEELENYVPTNSIRPGWKTASRQFDGSAPGAGDLTLHNISEWKDMFNSRQLLSLSLLLQRIEKVDSDNLREFLILAFSESLRYNNLMVTYNTTYNKIGDLFRTNSFDPPTYPIENNPWGSKWGSGTFSAMYEMVRNGVEYANEPTDRYIDDTGETNETPPFAQPIGKNASVHQGDMRLIDADNEYDAIITDPPYYDNIIYSELSDYFYSWQRILLKNSYDIFSPEATPRAESLVSNPAENKSVAEFEHELGEAFDVIYDALKSDGILTFTYHHSDSESWGELLESLCETGFEVTATYPVASDLNKFTKGEAVSFDIVVVARPTENRQPISWDSLRRRIVRTARKTRETLEDNRELASGDIGVIEMGRCFQEYSKHHGEVHRAGNVMSAKDVVDEIYGIIQDNDRGEQDIYRDLLEEQKPTYNDLNKHLKRSDGSEEQMRDMELFRIEEGEFVLCQWSDEKRQAYVQSRVEEGNGDLTTLDKAHFLRYRFEQGKSTSEYLDQWDMDELQELCEGLAEATHDETYLKMIGVDTSLAEFSDD